MAGAAQISYEHLNRIENYHVIASFGVLDRIARALGFPRVSDFLAADAHGVL